MLILAQIAGYSIVHLAITIVVIAAIVGLVFVALQQFGVAVPGWIVQVFWIVVAAFIIIAAIKIVASM